MPKDKISDYSATANSNTDIGGVNIDEGCAPSGINDAIRTLMKQLKDFQQGTNSDSFNGPVNGTVGATTPASGAFTTLSASSTLSVTGAGAIQGLTVGRGAGAVSTNTAVGASALAANTSGTANTALGYQALQAATADANTAVGRIALQANTTGAHNTVVGSGAAYLNTTGTSLVSIGSSSLESNTTGSSNVAIGRQALQANTTASNNTAVGYQAGYSNTTGGGNGGQNTFIGDTAGYSTTSDLCTFVGRGAGSSVTSGRKNTVLGTYNGNQGGLDIRTANNHIVLSDGDGNPRGWFDSNGRFSNVVVAGGVQTSFQVSAASNPFGLNVYYTAAAPNGTSNHFLYCEDTGGQRMSVRSNGGIANYSANNVNLSDRREKTNFAPAGDYLAKICAIPVQTFNYIDQNIEEDAGLTLGVVAQDVQDVAPELVMESNWANKDEEPKMRLSIYQTDLQYALMKSIQELKAIVDAQAVEIAALKGQA